tara:strand:+ start:3409 stop:4026 length:618 start_codon:yes stop_codon:yes gene_type:complete
MIIIIDYGMGNLGSIMNMFKYLNIDAEISNDIKHIKKASKLVLPGVGSFDAAMEKINTSGISKALNELSIEKKIPTLGICLGMQLLTNGSEEGSLPGLGWIDADTKAFPKNDKFKIPHVGWNLAKPIINNEITSDLEGKSRFYFVHSFYVDVKNDKNTLMKTSYGIDFDSGIFKDNIYGFQFHPEKSHKFGMQILKNFAKINVQK